MATQKVHFAAYLCVTTLPLDQKSTKAILVPKGAHITHLSIEVNEPSEAGGLLDIGFEGDSGALANDIDTSKAEVSIANIAQEAKSTLEVIATTTGATKGKATLRMQYFLPSTIAIEV